jgi:branched-chain amino acid transport system substrate-binding protein
VLRWCVPRFAASLAAFAMTLALAACGGGEPIVPAPAAAPQFHPQPPPPAPISAVPVSPPGTAKVALLLPMSGPVAALGKAMLQAAQLALFTTSNEHLTLIPRDTAAPAGAAPAARSAIGDGAQLILGPLLAADVAAVGPVAAAANVNVIGFSTATELAGGNVFLMGFLPRQEIAREVAFARRRGLQRFAALAPNSPYGHLMTNALREAVETSGGTVARVEYFTPQNGEDLTAAIGRLLQTATDAPATAPSSGAPPPPPAAASRPPNIDFDALLLPEGGAQLKDIAGRLQAAGLDPAKVRLLGSGLWDDPSIAGDAALYGGWFAASPPAARQAFESRFEATYGGAPPRLASLAFDAAALAAVLAESGDREPFSRDAIMNPRGFSGVDGLFRFTPQGLVQRGLAVVEIGALGNTVVSPAPTTFEDLAY